MKKMLKALALWTAVAMLPLSAYAVPANFVEGTHYKPTAQKLARVSGDDKAIEVVEMFSYSCPHCFRLDPQITAWEKTLPAGVKFIRVPAIFRDSWLQYAKVFYAAESMGLLEKLHPLLFNAMHVEKLRLNTEDQLLDFIAKQGVDREEFKKMMNSFAIRSKVKQALVMSQSSGITGVPTVIVNGEYMTDAPMAGGMEQMLQVVDFLIDKVKNEQ